QSLSRRRDRATDRRCAERRVWDAADLNDLCDLERVRSDHGSEACVSTGSFGVGPAVHSLNSRAVNRESGEPGAKCFGPTADGNCEFSASPRGIDRAGTDNYREADSVEHRRDILARDWTTARESFESASISDDFIQSARRRFVERRYRSSANADETESARNDHDELPGH